MSDQMLSLPASEKRAQHILVAVLVLAGLALTLAPYLLPLYLVGPGRYVAALSLRLAARYLAAGLVNDTPWVLLLGLVFLWRGRDEIAGGMFVAAGVAQAILFASLTVYNYQPGVRAWTGDALYVAGAGALLLAGIVCMRGVGIGPAIPPSEAEGGGSLFLGLGWAVILALGGTLMSFALPFLPVFGNAATGYHSVFDSVNLHTIGTLVEAAGQVGAALLLAAWGLARHRSNFAAGVLLVVGLFNLETLAWELIYPKPVLGRPLVLIGILSLLTVAWVGSAALLLRESRSPSTKLPLPDFPETETSSASG